MDADNLNIRFVPRYIRTVGKVVVTDNNGEVINSSIKELTFYYNENGELIKSE